MMRSDEGIAPVIAIVLLLSMVVAAGVIVGLSMFSALESAAGTAPDVRFSSSADNLSVYHAGGEVLYKKDLVFYDTDKKTSIPADSIKLFTADGSSSTTWTEWATGDRLEIGNAAQLSVLSIVGLDSRSRPALLYMGSAARVLPLGSMVPDEWLGGGVVWPPYEFNNSASWPELVEKVKGEFQNTTGGRKTYPLDGTIYYDDRTGTLCLAYCMNGQGQITSDEAESLIYLDEYAAGHPDFMPKLDFSNILTVNDTKDGDGKVWIEEKKPDRIGALYEAKGNLSVLALPGFNNSDILPGNRAWKQIGTTKKAAP